MTEETETNKLAADAADLILALMRLAEHAEIAARDALIARAGGDTAAALAAEAVSEERDRIVAERALAFVSGFAGPALQRHLDRAGQRVVADEKPNTEEKRARARYAQKAVARLIEICHPILPAPDDPVWGAMAADLYFSEPLHSTPEVLPVARRGRGRRDHGLQRLSAYFRLIVAIYAESARTGRSVKSIAAEHDIETWSGDMDCPQIDGKKWSKMKNAVGPACIDYARALGKRLGHTPHPDIDPERVKQLIAICKGSIRKS